MGKQVRMMNAAQQVMVTSVGQSVNENIVEDKPEEREEQDDVGGVKRGNGGATREDASLPDPERFDFFIGTFLRNKF